MQITLPNAGTYVLWGEAIVEAYDLSAPQTPLEMKSYGCGFAATPDGVNDLGGGQFMTYGGTISRTSTIITAQANDVVTFNCGYSGLVTPDANASAGAFGTIMTALQVK
jgi:hypothetical protein